ncbi:response regulator [Pedobacter aquatilis]|uniref:LytR/AlgR family response regulator transcription factor n=1 Tax=Pedobacter aquatilis TaxID=351343 RepID=UPI0025B3418A|nr:response regulator [Pedobacter aquatilis]MDN3586243.1 response regulator [Pedobacter aquatilis]
MQNQNLPKYTCVILDDDIQSVEILKHYIDETGKLSLYSSFTEPVEAAAAFVDYEMVDFLFLDIGMEVSGLDMARMLRNKVRFIVFVTAYTSFALEAFEHGDAYLVKPVAYDVFLRAINHVISKACKKLSI